MVSVMREQKNTQEYLCLIHQAGDQRWVRTAGSALHLLYSLYGPFSKVYGIGRCSKVPHLQLPRCVVGAFLSLRSNCGEFCPDGLRVVAGASGRGRAENSPGWNRKGFSHRPRWGPVERIFCGLSCDTFSSLTCVTLFTDVDFVTPLCSQVVYEGLVDDIFRNKCGEYPSANVLKEKLVARCWPLVVMLSHYFL